MNLEYKQAKMVTKVTRPKELSHPDVAFTAVEDEDIAEFTTWRGDFISNVLEGTTLAHMIQPGDKITITIEMGKDATWE